MASEGPNLPTTAATSANGGTIDWSNPTNVTATDGAVATAAPGPGTSFRLYALQFGFSAVSGTVNGITVVIRRRNSGGGTVQDLHVQLTKLGSSPVGTEHADTVSNWPAILTDATYGGSADDWSAGLISDDVMNGHFGVFVQATLGNLSAADIDSIGVTITYTPVTPGPPQTFSTPIHWAQIYE